MASNKSTPTIDVEEENDIINDIRNLENSNLFINEKKYYLKLIDILSKNNYYKYRSTYKQLWNEK